MPHQSSIVSVLLVPTEGDPHGLLKEGPCGARPPTASYAERSPIFGTRWTDGLHRSGWHRKHALVLAWKGEVVPEGLDRAYRAAGDRPERYHRMSEMPDAGMWFGSMGTIAFVDADGREVTP